MANNSNIDVLTTIIKALENLDLDTQKRTLQAVATFLNIPFMTSENKQNNIISEGDKIHKSHISFSENRQISPKEFIRDKAPKTDVERIACLAYYLTYYKETPHFKTLDISNLNTEAAQPKLSNAAMAVDNATKMGMLVLAGKGNKQISSIGEIYVQALPDREAARASVVNARPKRRIKKSTAKVNNTNTETT